VSPEATPPFDLYGVLELDPSADATAVEAAFRRLARQNHPDVSGGSDAATARMKRLNLARDWLTDPDRRRRYDAERGVTGRPVILPDIDPLGAWPTPAARSRPGHPMRNAMATVALMSMVVSLMLGVGSGFLSLAIFLCSVVVLAYCLVWATIETLSGLLRRPPE
jgi:antibiotic biosynthesis monooxygenase (ABM) superfamily enzyme